MNNNNLKEAILISTLIIGSASQANIPKSPEFSTYILEDNFNHSNQYSVKFNALVDKQTLSSELNKLGLSITNETATKNISTVPSLENDSLKALTLEQMLKNVFGEKVIEVLPADRIYLRGNDWGGTK
jgi:hypothetical protein